MIVDAIQSVMSILIMVGIGYFLARRGWFDDTSSKLFSRLVVNISLPALMLSNLLSTFNKEKLIQAGLGIFVPFIVIGVSYAVGFLISRIISLKPGRRGIFCTMFALSNVIFIGLPVNVALFGDESVPFVLLYYIANTSLFWTIGVYGIRRDVHDSSGGLLSWETVKRIISPPLLAFIFAIILILLRISLPNFIMDASRYIGGLTTPMSMLFIGMIIHSIDIKKIRMDLSMVILFVGRFLVTPLLALGLSFVIPIPLLMKQVFVIEAAMPVMTQTAIVSKAYGADHEYATVMATLTTLSSLIFIPLYMYVFTLL